MDYQNSNRSDQEKSKKKKRDKKKKKRTKKDGEWPNGQEANLRDPARGVAGAATPVPLEASAQKPAPELQPPGSHPFPVDDSDHCETPLQAYKDLEAVLDRLLWIDDGSNQRKKKRPRSELTIYDPYYCDGGVKTKLASMGFTNVINRNRDFYRDIESGEIPDYDVLVTNPPYSGMHMERILDFCRQQSECQPNKKKKKCFFLLLPHFVYTKDYYQRALSSNLIENSKTNPFFYFLVPEIRYAYIPPAWVAERSGASKALVKGKETTAPFPSFWYCHGPSTSIQQQQIHHHDEAWLRETFGPSGSFRSKHGPSRLRYARVAEDIPRDFKGEFDATKKRPNPRARKRQRQKQYQQARSLPSPAAKAQQQPKKKKKRRY
ncbi:unnamed protein product [Pseudo-nitzschia multistriata]|uniref:Uncharacterized protein n=1 Tax=Pseudo-nitzschia multistriata TaxID=183589 RepID=A0A448ZLP8_9STRA|nr:unnamed protein product [Pseudo-nitzschia multistriata]